MNRWTPLRDFTDDDLLAELVRRRNGRTVAKPEHWCHDCDHFKAWNEAPRKGEMPESFNPCTNGHAMKFRAPEDYGDDYGFYRLVCADLVTV